MQIRHHSVCGYLEKDKLNTTLNTGRDTSHTCVCVNAEIRKLFWLNYNIEQVHERTTFKTVSLVLLDCKKNLVALLKHHSQLSCEQNSKNKTKQRFHDVEFNVSGQIKHRH